MVTVRNGNGHTCALKNDGDLYCWGSNSAGQLGVDSTTSLSTPTKVLGLSGVSSVSLGDVFSCAVLSNSRAKCWGYGVYGALLQGSTTNLGANSGDMATLPYLDLGSE